MLPVLISPLMGQVSWGMPRKPWCPQAAAQGPWQLGRWDSRQTAQCGAEAGINPEGRCVGLMFLFHAGEEEDGDEDDEAEGATGKRAAEDDEVGRVATPSAPPVSPEGMRGGSAGPGWAVGLERPAHTLPPHPSPGTQPTSIYTLASLVRCPLRLHGAAGRGLGGSQGGLGWGSWSWLQEGI